MDVWNGVKEALGAIAKFGELAQNSQGVPQSIKDEGNLLEFVVGSAIDLRRERIRIQSSVRRSGNGANPNLRELFRLEKRVWQKLSSFNNTLLPYLEPAKLDLENLVKGGSRQGSKTPLDKRITYAFFENGSVPTRRTALEALRNDIVAMIDKLQE